MSFPQSLWNRPVLRWSLAGLAILMFVYTVFGFFVAPRLVSSQLPKVLEKNLNCRVELGEVKTNPFVLSLEARTFRIGLPDETPFAGFERLYLNFQLSSLFRWAWTFKHIELDRPYFDLVLEQDGGLNLAKLVKSGQEGDDQSQRQDPVRLLLHSIAVTNGTLEFDNLRQDPPAIISFDPITLDLDNLSTLPEREGPYILEATSDDGESLTWTGLVSLTPFWSNGTLAFENVRADTLAEFLLDDLRTAPPGGTLMLRTAYRLDTQDEGIRFLCRDISAALNDLVLRLEEEDAPFLELATIALNGGSFDLTSRQLDIPSLTFSNGTLQILTGENGTLNLSRAWRSEPVSPDTSPETAPESQGPPWSFLFQQVTLEDLAVRYLDHSRAMPLSVGADSARLGLRAELRTGPGLFQTLVEDLGIELRGMTAGPVGEEPDLELARGGLEQGRFDLSGKKVEAARLFLSDGSLRLTNTSEGMNWSNLLASDRTATSEPEGEAPASDSPWSFSLASAELSNMSFAFLDPEVYSPGPVISVSDMVFTARDVSENEPFPVSLRFTIDQGGSFQANGTADPDRTSISARVDLTDLSLLPAQPYIGQAADLDLRSGLLSLRGGLNAGGSEQGFPVTLMADLNVRDFDLVELAANATLLGWKSLHTDSLRFGLQPDGVTVDQVQLTEPRGRLIIDENTRVNVVQAFKKGNGNATAMTEDTSVRKREDPFPVAVGSLRMQDGTLEFSDLSLVLPFSTTIHDLDGLISQIASRPGSKAGIDLKGRVDEYGVSSIQGEIDFFDPKRLTDVVMIFENVDMTALNPYTATFAGRRIESGKLSLNLEYDIKNAALEGDNQIVVEQLTLGEKVQSERAVNLPLDLAVALLKDSSGTIDIGLPVSGDLNSPEFSFGHLIGRAIFSLLTKIVTSPFRILGALLPDLGSEDIASVSFEPGRAQLPPPQKEKVAQLATALVQRPQLMLTVQGHWVPEKDAQGLRELTLRRDIAQRIGRHTGDKEDPGPVNPGDARTLAVLKALFGQRNGAGALNALVRELESGSGAQNATAQSDADLLVGRELYARLQASQPLEPDAMQRLGQRRAQNVLQALAGQEGLDSSRMSVTEPTPLPEDEAPKATFELGASSG